MLVILGLPIWGDYTLELQLYDTYILIDHPPVYVVSGLIMFFYAVIYSLIHYRHVPIIPTVTVLQMLLTIGSLLILTIVIFVTGSEDAYARKYYSWTSFEDHGSRYTPTLWILAALMALVVSFLLMIINVIVGLTRKLKLH
jgi:hypothetical protein